MRLYTIQPSDTLQSIALHTKRSPRVLADVNGISLGTRLTPGDKLLIPVLSTCRSASLPTCLLSGEVEAGFSGTAPFFCETDLSLLFCHGGSFDACGNLVLTKRERLYRHTVPTLLCPPLYPGERLCPQHLIQTLLTYGYNGICINGNALPPPEIRMLSHALHESDLIYGIFLSAARLLHTPESYISLISCADILVTETPCDMQIEPFLSLLSSICPVHIRRKILLKLSAYDGHRPSRKKKTDTHFGCRNTYGQELRNPCDCIDGICRLAADGYGGVLTPIGRTSPIVYHMIHEVGQVIPASQRSGEHSHA